MSACMQCGLARCGARASLVLPRAGLGAWNPLPRAVKAHATKSLHGAVKAHATKLMRPSLCMGLLGWSCGSQHRIAAKSTPACNCVPPRVYACKCPCAGLLASVG
eukprot:365190-Chlamydomonas_euryale.AAC.3